ncbi:MAG TPA: hypothetical protein ENN23_07005, partial [Deltaproteobacteria bacterium]|nr:hypothetical protein [Deltaproteobacteria bacterium]
MNAELLLLIELQECDSTLVKLMAGKRSLPDKMEKLDTEFLTFKEGIEQNKNKYEELKNNHAEKEKEIK